MEKRKDIKKLTRKGIKWGFTVTPEVPLAISTKLPAIVMVLGVVFNEGDAMPRHIFSKGLRVNIENIWLQ